MTAAPHGDVNPPAGEVLDAVIIGGSQAGLAMAWHLTQRDLRFVVLEAAAELGHSWRSRWDSLRLFTAAQYDGLPGMPFPSPADTYPGKDAVADYLQAYAAAFDLPVRLNARVTALGHLENEFDVSTADQVIRARLVVVATGPFQTPFVPAPAQNLNASVSQLHSADYSNPQSLPDGPILIVGGGNSGMQIAEELAASRPVDLSMADKPPMLPQRLLGRDLFWWLTRTGLMRVNTGTRLGQRLQGRGDLVIGTSRRRMAKAGVALRPGVVDASGDTVRFADGRSLAVGVVIWATGYRSDFAWVKIPAAVHDGRVAHRRGVTDVPGLYFLGLSWQHTRGSALLGWVQHDAHFIAQRMAEFTGRRNAPAAVPEHLPVGS
jgi:putative flavoprotein involved in K+ transport